MKRVKQLAYDMLKVFLGMLVILYGFWELITGGVFLIAFLLVITVSDKIFEISYSDFNLKGIVFLATCAVVAALSAIIFKIIAKKLIDTKIKPLGSLINDKTLKFGLIREVIVTVGIAVLALLLVREIYDKILAFDVAVWTTLVIFGILVLCWVIAWVAAKMKFNLVRDDQKDTKIKEIIAAENFSDKTVDSKKIRIEIKWQKEADWQGEFTDIDLSSISVGREEEVRDEDFVFYNNTVNQDCSVRHLCDEKPLEENNWPPRIETLSEAIEIYLSLVSQDISEIRFFVTTYNKNGNIDSPIKIGRFCDLVATVYVNGKISGSYAPIQPDYDGDSLFFGALKRTEEEWKFELVGRPFDGGLGFLVENNFQVQ